MRFAVVVAMCLMSLLAGVAPSRADVLSRIFGGIERAGVRAASETSAAALGRAAAKLRAGAVASSGGYRLAADVAEEGHWRFVNAEGETFTASGPEEVARAAKVLVPASDGQPLRLILTSDSLFHNPTALGALPATIKAGVLVGDEVLPVEIAARAGRAPDILVAVRPNLRIAAVDRAAFDEAMWQLSRRLARAEVRTIALKTGGPSGLSATPRLDAASGKAITDELDPRALAGTIGAVLGQTLLVSGRLEGGNLVWRDVGGGEATVAVADLRRAAQAADASLIVLSSASPQQPGRRNWLWQTVEIAGLDKALANPTLADALSALIGDGSLVVTASAPAAGRTQLSFVPRAGAGGSGVGDVLTGALSEITGSVPVRSLEADMIARSRQADLDLRVVPWLPASVQFTYLGAFLVGLLGAPLSWRWFKALWPAERGETYGSVIGFALARFVRLAVFVLLALPLAGPVSMPLTLFAHAWDTISHLALLPWRVVRLIRRAPPQPVQGKTP